MYVTLFSLDQFHSKYLSKHMILINNTIHFVIGREPGPGLRMFSAKFFHYDFLITYTMSHRKFVMTTLNSGPFALRGLKKTFSGLKLGIFKYCVTVTSEIDIETPYLAESFFR